MPRSIRSSRIERVAARKQLLAGKGTIRLCRSAKAEPARFTIFEDHPSQRFDGITPPGFYRRPKREPLVPVSGVEAFRCNTGAVTNIPDCPNSFLPPNMLAPYYARSTTASTPHSIEGGNPLLAALLVAPPYVENDFQIRNMLRLACLLAEQHPPSAVVEQIIIPTQRVVEGERKDPATFFLGDPVIPGCPVHEHMLKLECDLSVRITRFLDWTAGGARDPRISNSAFTVALATARPVEVDRVTSLLRVQAERMSERRSTLFIYQRAFRQLFAWHNACVRSEAGVILADIDAALCNRDGASLMQRDTSGRLSGRYWEARSMLLAHVETLLVWGLVPGRYLDAAEALQCVALHQGLRRRLEWLRDDRNFDARGRVNCRAGQCRQWQAIKDRKWATEAQRYPSPWFEEHEEQALKQCQEEEQVNEVQREKARRMQGLRTLR